MGNDSLLHDNTMDCQYFTQVLQKHGLFSMVDTSPGLLSKCTVVFLFVNDVCVAGNRRSCSRLGELHTLLSSYAKNSITTLFVLSHKSGQHW